MWSELLKDNFYVVPNLYDLIFSAENKTDDNFKNCFVHIMDVTGVQHWTPLTFCVPQKKSVSHTGLKQNEVE